MNPVNMVSILQQNKSLNRKNPLIVGVSGGPDSLCLLHGLHQAGYNVIAAHLNHLLRREAAEEALFVESVAGRMGIPFVTREENAADYANTNTLSLEEAARNIRYHFLFEQALLQDAQAVAVAHTADDQVETVLMHLLRGAGVQGLKGMLPYFLPNPWSQEIPLVRPLLAVWREDTMVYCQQQGLTPVMDPSNQDTRFYRNRLRHELIPILEGFHPGARKAILRTANVLVEENEILEQQVDRVWPACLIKKEGAAGFRIAIFSGQPLGIKRRMIRRGIELLRPGLRDIDFMVVERVLNFLANPSRSSCTDLASGLAISLEGEILWLFTWETGIPGAGWPQVEAGSSTLSIGTPGEIRLGSGWVLKAGSPENAQDALPRAAANQDAYQAWLSSDALPLQVRGRRAGDRFQPLGLDGHTVKLSDYMVNVKLPRRARAGWPLVISSHGIIAWIPGFRLAHPYRITQDTDRAIHLCLSRES